MAVQDDERERELVRMFNLNWDPAHQRGGVDADLQIKFGGKNYRIEVEVKSTTGQTVSTARDVGMEHIRKWRSKLFVIGFYSKTPGRPELQRCICLTPVDMEPWIASIEAKILIDFKLAQTASRSLDLKDLFEVCGESPTYTLHDARRLHKNQWTTEQYEQALDVPGTHKTARISQKQMLEILKLRAKYIAERGATLNNPHITKAHLERFRNTDREFSGSNWAQKIRTLAKNFIASEPNHLAVNPVQS